MTTAAGSFCFHRKSVRVVVPALTLCARVFFLQSNCDRVMFLQLYIHVRCCWCGSVQYCWWCFLTLLQCFSTPVVVHAAHMLTWVDRFHVLYDVVRPQNKVDFDRPKINTWYISPHFHRREKSVNHRMRCATLVDTGIHNFSQPQR